jgi:integrase
MKTTAAFVIPIYPQLRPLIEKLCEGKKPNEHLFAIGQARKALTNACERLELPSFTQRSLRRMFITRAIERGVDVKVIAQWQGHKDGGKLILETYSHVRPEHSTRMAALMTTQEPENVISLTAQVL